MNTVSKAQSVFAHCGVLAAVAALLFAGSGCALWKAQLITRPTPNPEHILRLVIMDDGPKKVLYPALDQNYPDYTFYDWLRDAFRFYDGGSRRVAYQLCTESMVAKNCLAAGIVPVLTTRRHSATIDYWTIPANTTDAFLAFVAGELGVTHVVKIQHLSHQYRTDSHTSETDLLVGHLSFGRVETAVPRREMTVQLHITIYDARTRNCLSARDVTLTNSSTSLGLLPPAPKRDEATSFFSPLFPPLGNIEMRRNLVATVLREISLREQEAAAGEVPAPTEGERVLDLECRTKLYFDPAAGQSGYVITPFLKTVSRRGNVIQFRLLLLNPYDDREMDVLFPRKSQTDGLDAVVLAANGATYALKGTSPRFDRLHFRPAERIEFILQADVADPYLRTVNIRVPCRIETTGMTKARTLEWNNVPLP